MDPNIQLYEQLQSLLPEAHAESLHVVATFIDIRGFSEFSDRGGSFDTAHYLKSLYSNILTTRFPDRDFFKPTGDGLMLIHHLPTDSSAWPEMMGSILERSLNLVKDFGQLTANDYAVTPPVPQRLGVGVARGHATRLVSDGVVLDYTGPCLNIAARLMDKARPNGVVFSDSHAKVMMAANSEIFVRDQLCIRGLAEAEPIEVWLTPNVQIEQRDREPLTGMKRVWGDEINVTIAEVNAYSSYPFAIPRRPHSDEVAEVRISYSRFKDGKEDGNLFFEMVGDLEEDEDGFVVRIPLDLIQQRVASTPEKSELFLGMKYKNRVSFRPFIRPRDEK